MNTKKRIKILMTFAVAAVVILGMSTAAFALTLNVTPSGGNPDLIGYSGGPAYIDVGVFDAVTDINDLTIEWTSNPPDSNYITTFTQVDPENDPNTWAISLELPDYDTYHRWDAYVHVTDDLGTVKSPRIRILIYADACTAAKTADATLPHASDFNRDCVTNFLDLVVVADAWLEDFTPTGPFPAP